MVRSSHAGASPLPSHTTASGHREPPGQLPRDVPVGARRFDQLDSTVALVATGGVGAPPAAALSGAGSDRPRWRRRIRSRWSPRRQGGVRSESSVASPRLRDSPACAAHDSRLRRAGPVGLGRLPCAKRRRQLLASLGRRGWTARRVRIQLLPGVDPARRRDPIPAEPGKERNFERIGEQVNRPG